MSVGCVVKVIFEFVLCVLSVRRQACCVSVSIFSILPPFPPVPWGLEGVSESHWLVKEATYCNQEVHRLKE